MEWFPGFSQNGAKRMVSQLTDPIQRARAAAGLTRMGTKAVPALLDALYSHSPELPSLAGQVLAQIGRDAIPGLIYTLQRAFPPVRARAALILGQIKDAAAVPALLTALQGEFFTVRAAAATALGDVGDNNSLQALLKSLKDPEPAVRGAAALAVGAYELPGTYEELASLLLDDPTTEVRQAAARALGGTKDPAALPYLMEALHDSFWWYEREAAAVALLDAIQGIGEPAIQPLINSLTDPEGTIRRFAVVLLGNLRAEDAVEALGMALYDLHHEVGSLAGRALGQIGSPSLSVLETASQHPEPGIRRNAALGLGMIDHPQSAGLLLKLLEDPDRTVRMECIPGLAAQKDSLALAALMQLAGDRTDRELQSLAEEALNRLNLKA